MNKHTAILGILGLTMLESHSNIMGIGGKAHVRLTEEQLDNIEEKLNANDTEGLQTTINDHVATIATMNTEATTVASALDAAFSENDLTAAEGATVAERIAQLSTQCKTYGDSNDTHSIPKTDGKDKLDYDGLIDGYMDPNAEHNQLLTKIFS